MACPAAAARAVARRNTHTNRHGAMDQEVGGSPRIIGRRESAAGKEFLVLWPSATSASWTLLDAEKWSSEIEAYESGLRGRKIMRRSRSPQVPVQARRGHAYPADNGWAGEAVSVIRKTDCDLATARYTLRVAGTVRKAVSTIKKKRQLWGHEKYRVTAYTAGLHDSTEEPEVAAWLCEVVGASKA